MLCARLLCLAAVAATAIAAAMPRIELNDGAQTCDLTKVSGQMQMKSACDVVTHVLGSGKPISLIAVSAKVDTAASKVDTAASALSALANGVNKMKCDSVGLEGTRFGEGSGCTCPACQNGGILPTQVIDGTNPCQCECQPAWEGEQCQNKVACDKDQHCNGHATAVTGFLVGGCQCTCIAESGNTWKGSTCDTCESGADYDVKVPDATKKSRWQNENGQCAPCPDGWDCNGSSTKTDIEECAKEANQCNYGASCYDSHTAAPNTKAVGTWTCGCDTVTETTADKVFYDVGTGNCEYKKCADPNNAETHALAACTGNTNTLADGSSSTSAGSTWDGNSTVDACKCTCANGWSGDLCDTAAVCNAQTSECSSENTQTITGFTGAWTDADGDAQSGCKCNCKEGWTGSTCETSTDPSTTTWEYRATGNCPTGALVDTAAECTAAYNYLENRDDVAPLIDRSQNYNSDPAGCHIGWKGQLSMWNSASSGPCSYEKLCLCRKSTGFTEAVGKYTAQQMQYGLFSADPEKVIKHWTRESTTQCGVITSSTECNTEFNKKSWNAMHFAPTGLRQVNAGKFFRTGQWYGYVHKSWSYARPEESLGRIAPYGCHVYNGKMFVNTADYFYQGSQFQNSLTGNEKSAANSIVPNNTPYRCEVSHCLCKQAGSTPARL
jgi:hypothetical protein